MVTVVDATPARWDGVVAVMGVRGDPSWCWCQYFRLPTAQWRAADKERNRVALREQVAHGPAPPGVLALAGDEPVGWCAVGPRGAYQRLATSTIARAALDGAGVWAVTCFVVRVGHRRRGTTGALLAGAVDLARRHGATTIEGYPIDTSQRRASSAELYHGPLSVFLRAGFTEVARPTPARPVVRLELAH